MSELKRLLAKARRGERGVVIIYTAFFLLVLLGFVALGIDVSKLMATRTQLQRTADAAALAGASAINFQTGAITADTATVRAQATAALNKAFENAPTSVQLLAGDVSFPAPNQIKVIVRRDGSSGGSVVTHMAQVLGITSLNVTATATAEVSPADAACEGIIPMAPIADPAWFNPVCNGGVPVTYPLKIDQGDGGQQGNYQLLDFPDCTEGPCGDVQGGGGASIRCQTANGYSCCVRIGDELTYSQPGVKKGPFIQGMTQRWDSDTDHRENICYSNYAGNGLRVVRVPIVQTFDLSGKKITRIVGLAAFFLTRRPGGSATMEGQFIYDTTPGEPGGNPGTLYTIHLIK